MDISTRFYLSRMPIFGKNNQVCSYELLYNMYPESSAERSFVGLAEFIGGITGSAKAYLHFGDGDILGGVPKLLPAERTAVQVTRGQLEDGELLPYIEELHKLGYTIVLDELRYADAYEEFLGVCDIVKVNFRSSPKEIEETAYFCRHEGKTMLANNIETHGEFDYAIRLGCEYMEGFYFTRPASPMGNGLNPLPENLARAMRLISQPDAEMDDIVDALSQDAAICGKLLKLINSVYFGISGKVSAIGQAVVILGLDYLREWVYLTGIQRVTGNDNEEAIRLSLLNAKFCSKIAARIPEVSDKTDSFYLMGLLSMGVFIGKRQLARALNEFPLSDEIKTGLLRRGGVYSDVLDMALSYNKADWDRFDELARRHGLDGAELSELFVECVKEINN